MWKRTPSNATKKIVLARKAWTAAAVLVAALAALLIAVAMSGSGTETLRVNGRSYALDVADTNAARAQGLGGRARLAQNAGMLFVFPAAGQQCFWMKGMHFTLDIIWVSGDHRIVQIVPNLSPATYPRTYCASGTQYVIELNAGQATSAGMRLGQRLDFN